MNNYEKIKSMFIDEMAEMFAERIQCCTCFLCCDADKECKEIFKQWLQMECEE